MPGYFISVRHENGSTDTDDFCYTDRRHAEIYRQKLAGIFPNAKIDIHSAESKQELKQLRALTQKAETQ